MNVPNPSIAKFRLGHIVATRRHVQCQEEVWRKIYELFLCTV
jgi:hypothetical protein